MKVKQGLIIQLIDDSFTIYDPNDDKLVSLNLSASLIFEWILNNLSESEMIERYIQIYNISKEKAKEDIESVINELKKEGILEDDKEISDS